MNSKNIAWILDSSFRLLHLVILKSLPLPIHEFISHVLTVSEISSILNAHSKAIFINLPFDSIFQTCTGMKFKSENDAISLLCNLIDVFSAGRDVVNEGSIVRTSLSRFYM